ncbi:MAG TPA: hypothetical protein VMS60_08005 [Solirubrobacterales bacterium]|nr:hypothetical protein [Solirubrobacterales bacterium]
MNRLDVDQALSAANPIDLGEALPPLTSAEREFLGGVVAEPQEPAGGERPRRRAPGRRGIWARYLGGAAAVCAGAFALLLLPSSGPGPAPQTPAPAYADELARIAKQGSTAVVYTPEKKGSRAVVVEPRQQADGTTYVVKPLEDPSGWTEVDPAVVWDCSNLPCDRRTDTPQEAKEMFRKLQRAGN